MKAIHLNLSSRPYRDYRPVYAVIVLMSLLVVILGYYNVDTYLQYRKETKNTRTLIAQLEAQTTEEQQRTQSANDRLRSIDLALLKKQAEFVNSQLAERAFSWSELLDRLEKVLPDDVHIVSIAPSFDKTGQVHLSLVCEAKNGNGMVATIDRMNNDPHFHNPFPSTEENVGNGFHFGLEAEYHPSVLRVSQ
ncbi:MAG TPA: hypothetical protein VEZ11_09555 [Thermoanaerobaculia bacterium]|nr:hypothetical protein [Thermoanaerobaculia bacterium]